MTFCDLVEGHHCFDENYSLQLHNTDVAEDPTSTNVMAENRDGRQVPPKF